MAGQGLADPLELRREQALTWTPFLRREANSSGSSWEEREIRSAGTPASMARRTSQPELASKWSPLFAKTRRTAAFGQAFMAKRTVRPKALGNASMASAWASRVAWSYT